ncbi:MAG: ubiquinol-cytochrome C chaperone family protein [Pontixanthobacter sp.]
MSLFSRLFAPRPDPKEPVRPLWDAIVGEARAPIWYRTCGAADTVEGRFDMITSITAMVMLRLDHADDAMLTTSARLTELFAEDMEGQLRETGLGDPTLGKKMSKMMAALNGRIGAYRTAVPEGVDATAEVVARNSNLRDGQSPRPMAERLVEFSAHLGGLSDDALLAGAFGR